ncbi:MAG TPA: hypothetical protein VFO41_08985 [Alphaproteobacteria bacterium]|nr:hypothetical protein [Alphaproteobacteria bacterium]
MTMPTDCAIIGRRRIVEADLWGRRYLDLVVSAVMTIHADGRGEIAFGAMRAGPDVEYSRFLVFFTSIGFNEMDEVSGSGPVELLGEDMSEIASAYHSGREAA